MKALLARSAVGALFALLLATAAHAEGLEDELKDLNWVGFQQFSTASRVFVRTTEPARYRIDTSRPDMVAIILENTRIPLANNRRHLDTTYFDSPVRFIRPQIIEGPSPSVRIEIYLRQRVPFKEMQSDNVLALDFARREP